MPGAIPESMRQGIQVKREPGLPHSEGKTFKNHGFIKNSTTRVTSIILSVLFCRGQLPASPTASERTDRTRMQHQIELTGMQRQHGDAATGMQRQHGNAATARECSDNASARGCSDGTGMQRQECSDNVSTRGCSDSTGMQRQRERTGM